MAILDRQRAGRPARQHLQHAAEVRFDVSVAPLRAGRDRLLARLGPGGRGGGQRRGPRPATGTWLSRASPSA